MASLLKSFFICLYTCSLATCQSILRTWHFYFDNEDIGGLVDPANLPSTCKSSPIHTCQIDLGSKGAGPVQNVYVLVGNRIWDLRRLITHFKHPTDRVTCNIMVELTVSKRLVGATRPCMSQLLYHCFINFWIFL